VGHGPGHGLSFWDQLGLLPIEQWCSRAQEERNEVDAYLVGQMCSEQLPGDIGAQHQDVLVPRGLLGAPDRGLQPVKGKGPAVVAEEVLAPTRYRTESVVVYRWSDSPAPPDPGRPTRISVCVGPLRGSCRRVRRIRASMTTLAVTPVTPRVIRRGSD
jgi:hypothetical protein